MDFADKRLEFHLAYRHGPLTKRRAFKVKQLRIWHEIMNRVKNVIFLSMTVSFPFCS